MATALMRVCETGDYETAKLLIDEFEEFGEVDYKIQRIYVDRFYGKTLQEKREIVKTIEECNNYEPLDDDLIKLIENDDALYDFVSNKSPVYKITTRYYNK
jgi:hypothetical protein